MLYYQLIINLRSYGVNNIGDLAPRSTLSAIMLSMYHLDLEPDMPRAGTRTHNIINTGKLLPVTLLLTILAAVTHMTQTHKNYTTNEINQ